MSILRKLPYQFFLFLFFFVCLILFINDENTVAYGLQTNGIKSLVERGTFHIEHTLGSNIEYFTKNSTWDLFEYKGHVYLGKQPGQFFIASSVYFFLNKLGISYDNNYALASGLVAMFTSGAMTAFMMILIFNIGFYMIRNKKCALLISSFFGFGSLLLPYSGIVHHDIYATFFLTLSLYILFKRYHLNKKPKQSVLLSGFLVGLSFLNSYSSLPAILVLILYVLFHRNLFEIFLFITSLVFSISLCLIFNLVNFNDPFKFPITLYAEFHNQVNELTLSSYLYSIKERMNQYIFSKATGMIFYSPIYIVSLMGFVLFPKKYNTEKYIFPLVFLFAIIQPSLHGVLPNYGGCQYGPRYLMESIPLILVGLCGFFIKRNKEAKIKHNFLFSLIILTGILSIFICAVGSMNTINCDYYENAFVNYLKKAFQGDLPNYFMIPVGLIIMFLSNIFLWYKHSYKIRKTNLKLK